MRKTSTRDTGQRAATTDLMALPLPIRSAPIALLGTVGFALLLAAVVSQSLPMVPGT